MSMLETRRRQISKKGMQGQLRRPRPGVQPLSYTSVSLLCFLRQYRPDDLVGGIQQGDAQASILADEMTAAGWPAPPAPLDSLVTGSRTWNINGAFAIYDNSLVIGFDLWLSGGLR